jgi:DNA-binding SARP family transcriptional activator
VLPLAVGVLGVGIIGVLDQMRRAQQRRRLPGRRIRLPDGEVALLEHRLRLSADLEAVDWIDVGLRLLSAQARRRAAAMPRVLSVLSTSDDVVFRFARGAEGFTPDSLFEATGEEGSWRLARRAEVIRELQDDPWVVGIDPPTPALVTLGRAESGPLLVNLEALGSLQVIGERSGEFLRALVVELAAARWSGQLDLTVVGFATELAALERVDIRHDLRELLPLVQRRVGEQAALLKAAGMQTVCDARSATGGDAWDLLAIFVSAEAVARDPVSARELVLCAGEGGSGVVVVVEGPVEETRWCVDVTREPMVVEAGGIRQEVRPQRLDQRTLEDIAVLFNVATDTDGVEATVAPYDRIDIPIPGTPTTSVSGVDVTGERNPHPRREVEVEVRVLGPVEIVGNARPFSRAWAFDLVTYLAMHPKGATSEQWATALWPDRVMAPASLHSTASAARRCLGTSRSGVDHLPRRHGRLMLQSSVGTDWDRFVTLARSADEADWGRALELLRGRPFEGLRSADWALLEGIVATIEAEVVDLAMRYTQRCLDTGAAASAERAARQALRVSPYDERLYRVLLRTADLAGNPAGVESVMAELVYLVADGVEPFDAVHPETLDLYRSLSRRSMVTGRR